VREYASGIEGHTICQLASLADLVESAKISTKLAQNSSMTFNLGFQDENGPFKAFASLSKIFSVYCVQVQPICRKRAVLGIEGFKGIYVQIRIST